MRSLNLSTPAFSSLVLGVLVFTIALLLSSSATMGSTDSKRLSPVAITASTQQSTHTAACALDGRLDTRWTAASSRFPQWLKLDLGSTFRIDSVRLFWYQGQTRRYAHRTQLSVDGRHWKSFTRGQQARYVRLCVLDCSKRTGRASLREVRIDGRSLGQPAVPPTTTTAPTPTSSSPAPTIAGQTIRHLKLNGTSHDLSYANVTFVGGGNGNPDSSGVIEITGGVHDVTFTNCTIETNTDGVGDGIKIVDTGDGLRNITFRNCTIKTQPRFGFECIGRGSTAGYSNVNLISCTFEPQGSQAISYDDDSGLAGGCVIDGNLVKGGGAGDLYPYHEGIEVNGPTRMRVTNNTFYACGSDVWNLQMHTTKDCGWVFTGNVIDCSKNYIGRPFEGSCICAMNVYGGTFTGNSVTSAVPGNVAWLSNCHNMDWRSTSWSDPRGPSYAVPYQVNCSGNLF